MNKTPALHWTAMLRRTVLPAMAVALSSLASAGDMAIQPPQPFPSLEALVRKTELVLRCRAETVRGKTRWKVVEALKGEYRPKMFDQETPGYIGSTGTLTVASASRRAVPAQKHTEEIVFGQRRHLHSGDDNKWHDHFDADESLPVVADKITYPKTILWDHAPKTIDREFTLAEFILAIKAVR